MSVPNRDEIDLLRISVWVAVGLLIVHTVVAPGLLDGPITKIGDNIRIHWVPLALLVWAFVGHGIRLRRSGRPTGRGGGLSGPYPRSARDLD